MSVHPVHHAMGAPASNTKSWVFCGKDHAKPIGRGGGRFLLEVGGISHNVGSMICLLDPDLCIQLQFYLIHIYCMFADSLCEVSFCYHRDFRLCMSRHRQTEISMLTKLNLTHGIGEHTVPPSSDPNKRDVGAPYRGRASRVASPHSWFLLGLSFFTRKRGGGGARPTSSFCALRLIFISSVARGQRPHVPRFLVGRRACTQ